MRIGPLFSLSRRLRTAASPILLLCITGCENPFAPLLGDPVSIWTDQTTVGGLLDNFRNAYTRKDSLRYAECLACPDYRFNYFDEELGEYSWMPREVDLATTGRLFRHFSTVDLRWVGVAEELAQRDDLGLDISFTVFFELTLNYDVITGHARFSVRREVPTGAECASPVYDDDPVFRIRQWDDDL